MKYDYLNSQKFKPRKPWWKESFTKQEKSQIYQAILASPDILGAEFTEWNLSEKELYKLTVLERLNFDLKEFLISGTIQNGNYLMLAYFNTEQEKAYIFSVKETKLLTLQ